MKSYGWAIVILILLASCAQEKPNQKTSDQPLVESITQSAVDSVSTDPIPVGANQETFEDKPGLVRVSVNGPAASQQGNYLNGKREGVWSEFNPNGSLKSVTSYINGVKEGLYIELNPSGQLIKQFFNHNGIRHGEYKEFNYSSVKEERTYEMGKLEGLVKIYYDGGKIMEEGAYQNGQREGISKWYDQNGNVTITYEYKNGELVKK
jgi:phosphoribosylformylglycinamidine (FGAM) synthase-like amidotransferase family enzyme